MENNRAREIVSHVYVMGITFKMFLLTKYAVAFCPGLDCL